MSPLRRSSAPGSARTAGQPGRIPAVPAVLAVVLAAGLVAGCEYTYDDGGAWTGPEEPGATVAPMPAVTRDPLRRDPVGPAELDGWAARTLPGGRHFVASAGAGLLAAGEVRTETTPVLEAGTYALSLACRSQRRVMVTVRRESMSLVDLGLRCGINRENVIRLPSGAQLAITLEARTAANYAFQLRLL